MSNFFSRVTRYPLGGKNDPRENRVTEVTAAILEEVRGAPAAFLRQIIEADGSHKELSTGLQARLEDVLASGGKPEVSTQVATRSGKYVDLEVRVPGELVMWIEIKHGAALHGGQLLNYVEDISGGREPERVVALLAPRGYVPAPTEIPQGVLHATWQPVVQKMSESLSSVKGERDKWLLDQYFDFLRGEHLMDPERLDGSTAEALIRFESAFDALVRMTEVAKHELQGIAPWKPVNEVPGGKEYWAHFAKGTDDAKHLVDGVWFEWGLRKSQVASEGLPVGAWRFEAGLANQSGTLGPSDFIGKLEKQGFDVFKANGVTD